MNRDTLLGLLKEERYPEYMIDNTIAKLEHLQPNIASIFAEWATTGKIPEISIEGYTFSTLTHNFGMKPIGAFLTLDWLVREPQRARAALKKGIK